MFEQAELQPPPNGPYWSALNRPGNRANYSKPGLLGHLAFGHLGPNSHFGHFGQPFPNQGGHADEKALLGVLLKST